MSTTNQVARNFLALGSGETISRIIAFGVTIYLARILGADGYGVIAFAMGITLYLSRIADFCIDVIGTKEVAKSPDQAGVLVSSVLSLRLALAALLTIVAILIAQLFLEEPERTILSIFFLTLIPIAANIRWVHLGLENARPIGLTRIAGEVLSLMIVLCIVRSKENLWGVPLAQVAGESCFAFLLIIVLRRSYGKIGLRWDLSVAWPIFVQALPLLGQCLLGLIIFNSDLIFLRFFQDSETVGYYAAAYTLNCFLTNVGFSYGMSLLPTLTRLGSKTEEEKSLYQTALAQVYAVCLPMAVGGCMLASQIISLGFGDGFADSIPALQILILSVPITMLRIVSSAALIARGRQGNLLKASIYSVVANLILNILLIPLFGIIGAAVSAVITECIMGLFIIKYATDEGLPFVSVRRFWRATAACIFMAAALTLFGPTSLMGGLALGIASYGLALMVLGGKLY